MTRQARIIWFGLAAALVLAGVVAALIGSGPALIIALVLIGLGLILATSLVFFEVGLSEDRDRDRERKQREQRDHKRRTPKPPGRIKRPRLDRSRGQRRRLR
jgi:membrane protein implicated in regulation of membrane protease activity